MKEITRAIRLEVAQFHVLGYSFDQISDRTGISHGSVANIVKELEVGRLTIPGVSLDQVSDLRQLARDLKKKNLQPSQAMLGLAFFERVRALGIAPERLDARASAEVLEGMVAEHVDLPGDIPGLCAFCNEARRDYVDIEGKFKWVNGEAAFGFGMHGGRLLMEMAEEHPDYLLWILRNDFRPDVHEIVRKALDGEFPHLP